MATIIGVIVSAGMGTRLGFNIPKCFIELMDKPLFRYSLETFIESKHIDRVILMVPKGWADKAREYLTEHDKPVTILEGGKERIDTVKIAIDSIIEQNSIVAIHDGARPLLPLDILDNGLQYFLRANLRSMIFALPVRDTLKLCKGNQIRETIDRANLFQAQTPQVFQIDILRMAINKMSPLLSYTDDAQLVESAGLDNVSIFPGSPLNFKITDTTDLNLARQLLGIKY